MHETVTSARYHIRQKMCKPADMPRPRKFESEQERNRYHTERRMGILRAVRELHERISEAAEVGNETAAQLLGADEAETLQKIAALFPSSPNSATGNPPRKRPTLHR